MSQKPKPSEMNKKFGDTKLLLSVGNEKTSEAKIAYYVEHKQKGFAFTADKLADCFYVEKITAEEIRKGILKKFDILIIPGGYAPTQAADLEACGVEKIREFIQNGGGYFGICAGAYLATLPPEPESADWNWGLLKCYLKDLNHWKRGKGDNCLLNLTQEALHITNYPTAQPSKPAAVASSATQQVPSNTVSQCIVRYANGPLFKVHHGTWKDKLVSEPIIFATFGTEYTENGAPAGKMINSPALIGGLYGKGRVLASSPHPEKAQDTNVAGVLQNFMRWLAGKIPTVPPVPTP